MLTRLPEVQRAFTAGMLDQPRVRIFSSWTLGLADEHADAIVAAVLPTAHLLTTAQLIDAIQRYAIALDPDWAKRRYERALKGRRVVGRRNEDGTSDLCGYDLPTDQVAAACARLDRLAKAAKHAGHTDPIDHVRSYLFLGMTDGSYEGLTDPQILARLLAQTALTPSAPAEAPPRAGEPSAGDYPDGNQPDEVQPAGGDDSDPGAGGPGPGDGDNGGPGPGDGNSGGPGPAGGEPRGDEPTGGGTARRDTGLRLLMQLATLAGADQRPAELLGWGAVHAELARTMAHAPGASWWYVLTGPDGAPQSIGRIRRRPDERPPGCRGHRGLQVWLKVTKDTLDYLAQLRHPPGWDRVLAEIIATADANAGPPNGDPSARLPGAALRRWIQIRDRSCEFPGCRVPAHRADADHSTEHAQGGQTIDANLGPACRHDHRLRHAGGWTLSQPTPGQFAWTSRFGHTYLRQPPPDLDDLPEPMPVSSYDDAGDETEPPSTEDWQNSTCMEPGRIRPPERPPPPPPPPPSPEDDIPPF